MGRYVLEVPRWHPCSVNALLRSVKRRIRLKQQDREMVWSYGRLQQIPLAKGKRRVQLTIILAPHQRAHDPDAYTKSLGDALVQAHLLVNDSYLWVEWMPTRFERSTGGWGTRIMLEDLKA
jgi:hypothetical protein